jgi:hypothetical protein
MDRTVRLWPAPVAQPGAVPQVVLWANVSTGMELDPGGGLRVLKADVWQQRSQQFREESRP